MPIEIQKTQDYDLFKEIKGNRTTSKSNVNKLREAIRHNPASLEYNPILINEKWEVVNGKHRLEAARAEEVPVYFVQVAGLGLKDVQKLNAIAKVWSPLDYAHSYAEIGLTDYRLYVEFKKFYKLNHDILMAYMSLDRFINTTMFREGKFSVPDANASANLCDMLKTFEPYFDRANTRSFAMAFKQLATTPKYNHSIMLTQLERYSSRLKVRALPKDYLEDLIDFYNYYRQGKRLELTLNIK